MAQKIAKEKGYSDVLYLDAVHKKYLEEVSSCNIFVVKVKLAISLDCALMF
jgi:branched-chain amino acid aminotransferase